MVVVAVRQFTAGLARVVSWMCTDTELIILPLPLFLYFCFAEQMAEAWSLALEAAKVPEAARQKLIQLGYETQDAFNFDDDDTFKAFMKQFLLVEWKPDGVTEQTWFFHPIVGKLKAVEEGCRVYSPSFTSVASSFSSYTRFGRSFGGSQQDTDSG